MAGLQVPPADPGHKRPASAASEVMPPPALGAPGLPRAPAGAGASPLKRRRLESQLSPAGRGCRTPNQTSKPAVLSAFSMQGAASCAPECSCVHAFKRLTCLQWEASVAVQQAAAATAARHRRRSARRASSGWCPARGSASRCCPWRSPPTAGAGDGRCFTLAHRPTSLM